MNDRARSNVRMAIYSMAGVYLLFMAYYLIKSLGTSNGGEKILMIVFSVLFILIGVGLIGFSFYCIYKRNKEEKQRRDNPPDSQITDNEKEE